VIAACELPEEYRQWNRANGAPHGRVWAKSGRVIKFLSWKQRSWLRGPYGIQPNNRTREFEYPWAWHAAKLVPGMDVVEIGGGLSGFQFSLSRFGCNVTNVDPGMNEHGWPCNPESISVLNRTFRTQVRLMHADISRAELQRDSYDRVFCISVMEHLDEQVRHAAMRKAYDCLRPGGLAILTVDLFLGLTPFTNRESNRFGTNCNVRRLIEAAPFRMILGREDQLFGFDAFSTDAVMSNLSRFLIGENSVVAQCFVLEK
jgi:SAM-dependent methyltransferase